MARTFTTNIDFNIRLNLDMKNVRRALRDYARDSKLLSLFPKQANAEQERAAIRTFNVLKNVQRRYAEFVRTAQRIGAGPQLYAGLKKSVDTFQSIVVSGKASSREIAIAYQRLKDSFAEARASLRDFQKQMSNIQPTQGSIRVTQNLDRVLRRAGVSIAGLRHQMGATGKAATAQAAAVLDFTRKVENFIASVERAGADRQLARKAQALQQQFAQRVQAGPLDRGTLTLLSKEFSLRLARLQNQLRAVNQAAAQAAKHRLLAVAERLSEMASSAQIALGPLSGVASRLTAFVTLVRRTDLAIASLITTLIAFGAAILFISRRSAQVERHMLGIQEALRLQGVASGVAAENMYDLAEAIDKATLGDTAETLAGIQKMLTSFDFPDFEEEAKGFLTLSTAIGQAANAMTMQFGGRAAENLKILGRVLERPLENLDALRERGIQFTHAEKLAIAEAVRLGDRLRAGVVVLGKFRDMVAQSAAEASGIAGSFDTLVRLVVTLPDKIIFARDRDLANTIKNLIDITAQFADTLINEFGLASKASLALATTLKAVNLALSTLLGTIVLAGRVIAKVNDLTGGLVSTVVRAAVVYGVMRASVAVAMRVFGFASAAITSLAGRTVAAATAAVTAAKAFGTLTKALNLMAAAGAIRTLLTSFARLGTAIMAIAAILIAFLPDSVFQRIQQFVDGILGIEKSTELATKAADDARVRFDSLIRTLETLRLRGAERGKTLADELARVIRSTGDLKDAFEFRIAEAFAKEVENLDEEGFAAFRESLRGLVNVTRDNLDEIVRLYQRATSRVHRVLQDLAEETRSRFAESRIAVIEAVAGSAPNAGVGPLLTFARTLRKVQESLGDLAKLEGVSQAFQKAYADIMEAAVDPDITRDLQNVASEIEIALKNIETALTRFAPDNEAVAQALQTLSHALRLALTQGIQDVQAALDRLRAESRNVGADMDATVLSVDRLSESLVDIARRAGEAAANLAKLGATSEQIAEGTVVARLTAFARNLHESILRTRVAATDLEDDLYEAMARLRDVAQPFDLESDTKIFEIGRELKSRGLIQSITDFALRVQKARAEIKGNLPITIGIAVADQIRATAEQFGILDEKVDRLAADAARAATELARGLLSRESIERAIEFKRELAGMDAEMAGVRAALRNLDSPYRDLIQRIEEYRAQLVLTGKYDEAEIERLVRKRRAIELQKAELASLIALQDRYNNLIDERIRAELDTRSAAGPTIENVEILLRELQRTGRFLNLGQIFEAVGKPVSLTIEGMKKAISSLTERGLITPAQAEAVARNIGEALSDRVRRIVTDAGQILDDLDRTQREKRIADYAKMKDISLETARAIMDLRRLIAEAVAAGAPVAVVEKLKRALKDVLDHSEVESRLAMFRRMAESIAEAFDQAGKNLVRGLLEGTSVMEIMRQLAYDIGSAIIESLVQSAVVKPLTSSIEHFVGTFIPSLFGFGAKAARGAVFDRGEVVPFASGGIVKEPTVFPMKKGFGLVGEAGPEAVLPLTRIGGKLGVLAKMDTQPVVVPPQVVVPTNVNIQIVNRSSSDVSVREVRNGPTGTDIVLEVVDIVGRSLAKGDFDRHLATRYGVTPRGQ